MPADIPEIEPTQVTAGDTLTWTKDLSDYPADEWTLTYYLLGPQVITVVATADDETHSVTVSAATSAVYAPGNYKWTSYVSAGSERYKVGEGLLSVLANPATAKGYQEARSEAKQILDALMVAYRDRAGRPEQSYSIQAAGQSFTFLNHADLITAIQFWQAEVKKEEVGENVGRNVLVRFGST